MASESLVRKKIQVSLVLLVFFSILTHSRYANAITDGSMIFDENRTEQTISYVDKNIGTLALVRNSGIASYNFDIYDFQGNLVKMGFFEGELPKDKMLYPLTFKINANTTENHFFLQVKVVYTEDNSALDNIADLIKALDDDLLNKLDQLKSKLDGIATKLAEINDYLSNPAYLQVGLDNMDKAIDKVTTNPLVDMGSAVTTLGGISGSSGGGGSSGFEIPLKIGDTSFNAFDISALGSQLSIIRDLMKAIIWIEFAVFCIRVVVPKFKV